MQKMGMQQYYGTGSKQKTNWAAGAGWAWTSLLGRFRWVWVMGLLYKGCRQENSHFLFSFSLYLFSRERSSLLSHASSFFSDWRVVVGGDSSAVAGELSRRRHRVGAKVTFFLKKKYSFPIYLSPLILFPTLKIPKDLPKTLDLEKKT